MSLRAAFILTAFTAAAAAGADFEYNTGGYPGYPADLFGSSAGWGEWFVTTVQNPLPVAIQIMEFGFPCSGSATGPYGWVVWEDLGLVTHPSGGPQSCDHHGEFTPVEGPYGDPSVYTWVDVSAANVIIPAGAHFCFGYRNTAYGGQTPYNGVLTWSWFDSMWIVDSSYYRTAVMQVSADVAGALEGTTWAAIKAWR